MLDDLRLAIRLLRKAPFFTATIVATLALGVGVNTAAFSVVNAFMLRPLPVRDAGRLVVLASERPRSGTLGAVSFPDLRDYRAAARDVVEDVAGYSVGFVGLALEGGRPDRVLATWVTGSYFPLLGIEPALGRFIDGSEAAPGRLDTVVVLGHATWMRRFGGDPGIVGSLIRVNGRPCTIVGVAPPGFAGTFAFSESELYLPANWNTADLEARDVRWLHALGRLRHGVALASAQAAFTTIASRLERVFPDSNSGVSVRVLPERLARPIEDAARSNAAAAAAVLTLVALVLGVAAVNVANLLMARAAGRRRELAIRTALGAGRGRLVRQLAAEAGVLAALGGAAGIVGGVWLSAALTAVRLPGDLPVRFDFSPDWRVVLYGAAVMALTGLLAGVLPGLAAARVDPGRLLRDSGGAWRADGPGRQGVRRALVTAQVAASVVVLIAAGSFWRSQRLAERADLGFRPDGVLNVHMDVDQLGYREESGRVFFDDVERRVRELPGVGDASWAQTVPLGYVSLGASLNAEGQADPPAARVRAGLNAVGPRYFATLGIPVVRGRAFTPDDDESSRLVAIVNERLGQMLWPGRSPIGRRFSTTGPDGPWLEVVGVTTTGRYRYLFEDPQPFFYLPLAQHYSGLRVLHIAAAAEPEALAPAVERVVHERAPDLPLYDVQTMTRALGGGYGFFLVRAGALSAAVFGLLGLALALGGLYGLVSYLASRRSHEIGVRVALGATPRDIVRLVLRDGAPLVGFGLAAGAAVALAGAGAIDGLLFGVSARDPLTLAAAAAIVAGVGLAAAAAPACRASRADPTVAIRSA